MSAEYNAASELPEKLQPAARDLVLCIADTKHLLGLRYGQWLCAPVLESSIAASAMAQDEFGHARLFYTLAEEFVKLGLPQRKEIPDEYRNIEVLDRPFEGWLDFVAANALVDAALLVQLEAFGQSSLASLRRLVPKLCQEEAFHVQHAKGWVTQLAHANERAKAELEKAMKRIWSTVLCWFGPQEDSVGRALIEGGIQDVDGEGLRARWLERVGPVLEAAGLDLPVSNDAITGQWILSTELSWKGWDPHFRRFTRTGPDAETFKQIECFSKHEYPVGT